MITDKNPQQPTPQPPANQTPNGQYDFIMNPEKPSRPKMSLDGTTQKLIVGVAILAVVVIVLAVVMSLMRGGNANADLMTSVAQQQQEIIRVSQLQADAVSDQDTKNFVINTLLSMQSDQQTYLDLLASNGVKVSDKQLALGQNSATDTTLENAVASNSLNDAIAAELRRELQQYQGSVQQLYSVTSGQNGRAVLQNLYDNAGLLIEQSKQ